MTAPDAPRAGELEALIARLEAATEGSRELDCEIYCAIKQKAGDPPPTWLSEVPNWTTSIDAALTLVPEECGYIIGRGKRSPNEPLYGAQVFTDLYGSTVLGEAETDISQALTICLAALRARSVP